MHLFEQEAIDNILPYEGRVSYYGKIFADEEANKYFEKLLHHIEWKNDEAFVFGKHFITKRKVAWYGDQAFEYTYSNTTKKALSWTKELVELKQKVEEISGATFNACLMNLYHDGSEGMAWHSDDEKDLAKHAPIACLTLGAVRKFSFKHKKTNETVSLYLENGSLLLMLDETQSYWKHRLPTIQKMNQARISLTFRTMMP